MSLAAWRTGTALQRDDICARAEDAAFPALQEARCAAQHLGSGCFAVGGLSAASGAPIVAAAEVWPAAGGGEGASFACRVDRGQPCCLAWRGTELACGTTTGQVLLFKADAAGLRDGGGGGAKELLAVTALTVPGLAERVAGRNPAAPGGAPWSLRIAAAALTAEAGGVLGAENDTVHLWDARHHETPAQSVACGIGQLASLALPIDVAGTTADAAVGASGGGIALLDLRAGGGGVATPLTGRDGMGVRSMRWHSFSPWWVAAGMDDGMIRVHDIRRSTGGYGQSSAIYSFRGHRDHVASLCWSPTHADILLSGGAEGSAKLWSLQNEPHGVLATASAGLNDALIAAEFSRASWTDGVSIDGQHEFSVAGADGSVGRFLATAELVEPFAQFRLQDENSQGVEMLLHSREVATASELVLELAQKAYDEGDATTSATLINLLEPQPCIDAAESPLLQQLQAFTYALPPHFQKRFVSAASDATANGLRMLKESLDVQLLSDMRTRTASQVGRKALRISDTETRLMRALEQDGVLDLSAVLSFLKATAAAENGEAKAVEFAMAVGQVLESKDRGGELWPIAYWCLYPTIFDAKEGTMGGCGDPRLLPAESAARRLLSFGAEVSAQQLAVKACMLATHAEDAELTSERLVVVVEGIGKLNRVLSKDAVRQYLRILLKRRDFKKLLLSCCEICDALREGSSPQFYAETLRQLQHVANVALPKHITRVVESEHTLETLVATLLSIAALTQLCRSRPWIDVKSIARRSQPVLSALGEALKSVEAGAQSKAVVGLRTSVAEIEELCGGEQLEFKLARELELMFERVSA